MKSEEAENKEEIKKSQDVPERKDSQVIQLERTNKIESEDHPLEVNANINQQEVYEQLFPKAEYYKDMMLAAINKAQYFDDLGCGAWAVVISISNPYQAIGVRILDQCPECAHGFFRFLW